MPNILTGTSSKYGDVARFACVVQVKHKLINRSRFGLKFFKRNHDFALLAMWSNGLERCSWWQPLAFESQYG